MIGVMKETESPAPSDAPKYSIGELARLGEVSRRTVRYYVQRGLLPAPAGTGRGSRYSQRHLNTLIRIRELQQAGVPLADISRRLLRRSNAAIDCTRPTALPESTWTRIVLADGVELHLEGRGISPEQRRALSHAISEIVVEGGKP